VKNLNHREVIQLLARSPDLHSTAHEPVVLCNVLVDRLAPQAPILAGKILRLNPREIESLAELIRAAHSIAQAAGIPYRVFIHRLGSFL
jgi:hypothetical protein